MINWNVGGGVKHSQNLINFNYQLKTFYDTPHNFFNSVFDSTFGLRWNGGRICHPHDSITLKDFMILIRNYNSQGIGFNFTFSNRLLQEIDLEDEYCNLLLSAAEASQSFSKMNGVIMASPLLREYVAKNYPSLKRIWSVCNGVNKLNAYNNETNNDINDIVVLHPDFNHNNKFLSQLENKNKIEIMVNDMCAFGCPFRAKHYDRLSQFALQQSTNPIIHDIDELDQDRSCNCEATTAGMVKDGRNRLTFNDINNLHEMGFQQFKLIGREHEWDYYYEKDLMPNLEQLWVRNNIKDHWHI